jgi:hypothetical protein
MIFGERRHRHRENEDHPSAASEPEDASERYERMLFGIQQVFSRISI